MSHLSQHGPQFQYLSIFYLKLAHYQKTFRQWKGGKWKNEVNTYKNKIWGQTPGRTEAENTTVEKKQLHKQYAHAKKFQCVIYVSMKVQMNFDDKNLSIGVHRKYISKKLKVKKYILWKIVFT